MEKEQFTIEQIKQQGLLPLFYHDDAGICQSVVKALHKAGAVSIEFTNRGPKALENFKKLVRQRDADMKNLLLGVGTIKTGDEAIRFIEAGADFLVSPVFDAGVCDVAYMHKSLWIPGCMTPTEIHIAQQAGCKMIKLFPGNVLGPAFVEAIRPLFNGLDFVVTGGVDAGKENLQAWFKSGVVGVGMGSKLISKTIIDNKDYKGLETKTKQLITMIRKIKA
jgi:2-dehydro-3-deoxyphosphogluconate aldolase / (4S)-4-hydroxy-2-oxoglutarate aldolase